MPTLQSYACILRQEVSSLCWRSVFHLQDAEPSLGWWERVEKSRWWLRQVRQEAHSFNRPNHLRIRLSESPALEAAANDTAQLPASAQHDKKRTEATEITRNSFRLLVPERIKIRPNGMGCLPSPSGKNSGSLDDGLFLSTVSSYLGQLSASCNRREREEMLKQQGGEMGYRLARLIAPQQEQSDDATNRFFFSLRACSLVVAVAVLLCAALGF